MSRVLFALVFLSAFGLLAQTKADAQPADWGPSPQPLPPQNTEDFAVSSPSTRTVPEEKHVSVSLVDSDPGAENRRLNIFKSIGNGLAKAGKGMATAGKAAGGAFKKGWDGLDTNAKVIGGGVIGSKVYKKFVKGAPEEAEEVAEEAGEAEGRRMLREEGDDAEEEPASEARRLNIFKSVGKGFKKAGNGIKEGWDKASKGTKTAIEATGRATGVAAAGAGVAKLASNAGREIPEATENDYNQVVENLRRGGLLSDAGEAAEDGARRLASVAPESANTEEEGVTTSSKDRRLNVFKSMGNGMTTAWKSTSKGVKEGVGAAVGAAGTVAVGVGAKKLLDLHNQNVAQDVDEAVEGVS
uniref:Senescence domain-containing protein n=1 Tax=Chromera velia CCMP2878 TaxID=1169474 RepID=A0A0G4GSR2_9ALVE|eukprot:Cvel_23225.t1-p1 / transcript=Cvel_23225.t1 / gene=Cvel_23225 / organism=Chromera_velia_CCMP2878 / gene_product=hypothetical protein / transcript_product=hypothetical protein / location=Cvel_scaffold2370:11654-13883(-) / protein_length=355 / sequence_SO=supercontig / SO=protein_coding / is_pseudo=false